MLHYYVCYYYSCMLLALVMYVTTHLPVWQCLTRLMYVCMTWLNSRCDAFISAALHTMAGRQVNSFPGLQSSFMQNTSKTARIREGGRTHKYKRFESKRDGRVRRIDSEGRRNCGERVRGREGERGRGPGKREDRGRSREVGRHKGRGQRREGMETTGDRAAIYNFLKIWESRAVIALTKNRGIASFQLIVARKGQWIYTIWTGLLLQTVE